MVFRNDQKLYVGGRRRFSLINKPNASCAYRKKVTQNPKNIQLLCRLAQPFKTYLENTHAHRHTFTHAAHT